MGKEWAYNVNELNPPINEKWPGVDEPKMKDAITKLITPSHTTKVMNEYYLSEKPKYQTQINKIKELILTAIGGGAAIELYLRGATEAKGADLSIEFCRFSGELRVILVDWRDGVQGGYRIIDTVIPNTNDLPTVEPEIPPL